MTEPSNDDDNDVGNQNYEDDYYDNDKKHTNIQNLENFSW